MATATDTSRRGDSATPAALRVSAYDNVASLLVALLIFVGGCVVFLFVIWLTTRILVRQKPVPVELVEYAGRGDHAAGFARDMEEPGVEELDEVIEPQIDVTLQAVTDAVSATEVKAVDIMQTPATGASKGKGLGDSRGPGPLGEGRSDIVPPWERWEIRFTTAGIDLYAQQLDFFHIELGAAGGGADGVEYAFHLSQPRPDRRTGKGEEEDRLYMTWQKGGPLAAFDRQLLERAGIKTQRRLLLQFYTKDVERQLATLEMQNAKGRDVAEFSKTIFGVRAARGGYEFVVLQQYFRPAPRL